MNIHKLVAVFWAAFFLFAIPLCAKSEIEIHGKHLDMPDSIASISVFPDSGRSATTFKVLITDINLDFTPTNDPAELENVNIDLRWKDGISYYHTHPSVVLSSDSMEAIIAIPDSLEANPQYYMEVASSSQSSYDFTSNFPVRPRVTASSLGQFWIAEGDTVTSKIIVRGAQFMADGNSLATNVNLVSGESIIPATNIQVKSADTMFATFIIPANPLPGPYSLSFTEPGTDDSIYISNVDFQPRGVFYMLVVRMSPNTATRGETTPDSISGADAGPMAGIWTFSLNRGHEVITGIVDNQEGSNFWVTFQIPVSAETGSYDLIIPLGDYGTGDTVIVPNAFTVNASSIVLGMVQNSSYISSYPNPLSQSTQISFTSENAGYADISIVNVLGQEVARLFSGEMDAGEHSFEWNASDVAPGSYWCVVRTADGVKRIALSVQR